MDRAEAARVFTPAAAEALRAFPIEPVGLTLVALSENVTFKVTDERDGAAYVLRLHRPGYHTLAELTSERLWTRALAEAGVAVPIALATTAGADYVSVAVAARGETRQAGMAGWTEGDILADVLTDDTELAVLERHFEALGAIQAAMHAQSAAWRPPPDCTRRAVDAEGLMGEAPHWGPFWDHPVFTPADRRLVLATRDRIRAALARHGRDPATYGVIHADLHSGNVLVGPGGLTVIDFDDAAFGWHAYDIAVGLTHHRASPHLDAIQAAFVRGYRARRPLSEATIALIPMFLLIRGLAQIGWLGQRPEIDASGFIGANRDWVVARCKAFVEPC